MVGVGIIEVLLELAVTFKVWLSLAAPEPMPPRLMLLVELLSATVRLPMEFSVGGLFTVTVNERLNVPLSDWPSETVTVTVAVPQALATGANVSVPLELGLL